MIIKTHHKIQTWPHTLRCPSDNLCPVVLRGREAEAEPPVCVSTSEKSSLVGIEEKKIETSLRLK